LQIFLAKFLAYKPELHQSRVALKDLEPMVKKTLLEEIPPQMMAQLVEVMILLLQLMILLPLPMIRLHLRMKQSLPQMIQLLLQMILLYLQTIQLLLQIILQIMTPVEVKIKEEILVMILSQLMKAVQKVAQPNAQPPYAFSIRSALAVLALVRIGQFLNKAMNYGFNTLCLQLMIKKVELQNMSYYLVLMLLYD